MPAMTNQAAAIELEDLEEYTLRHPHPLTGSLPPLLDSALKTRHLKRVVDLGCGDGQILWALRGEYTHATAVDLSPGRIERLKEALPEVDAVVADAANTGFADGIADSVVCSQVIEHVPDDIELAREIRRLLAPNGWFYVGSVMRTRHAFWFYRHSGRWWLDPTHLREYTSSDDFRGLLEQGGLNVDEVRVTPFRFPIADMVLRAGVATRVLSPDSLNRFYVDLPDSKLRSLRFQPPGYFIVEAIGTRH